VAAAVSGFTSRLKSLVAFRPGFVLPAVAAQTVATLQRFTGNRLLLNVVTGGNSAEQRGFGDFLDHDARYERTDEFLSVVRLWAGIGLVRGGAGTAVIGSHEQVAARIAEYEALGVDTFIFSAYPNLEEAVRVGEDLLPLLRRRERQRPELSLVGAS